MKNYLNKVLALVALVTPLLMSCNEDEVKPKDVFRFAEYDAPNYSEYGIVNGFESGSYVLSFDLFYPEVSGSRVMVMDYTNPNKSTSRLKVTLSNGVLSITQKDALGKSINIEDAVVANEWNSITLTVDHKRTLLSINGGDVRVEDRAHLQFEGQRRLVIGFDLLNQLNDLDNINGEIKDIKVFWN